MIYLGDFWQLICDYKVYKRISPEVLARVLEAKRYVVWSVLRYKELVLTFGQVITEHLMRNPGYSGRTALTILRGTSES